MNAEVTSISATRKRLTVEVPAEEVQKTFDGTLRSARKELALPGYRKGKAPMELVRARFGEADLGSQVSEALVERYLGQAIDGQKLQPLPRGVFRDLEEGQEDWPPAVEGEAYSFAVLVDVLPEFELGTYTGLTIARPTAELDDEEVLRQMDEIRESMGHMHPVEDRPSASPDFVEVEIEGQAVGADGPKLEKKTQRIHLGADGNLPEFDKELSGRRAGEEFEFQLVYPEDFPNEDFQGKTMHFSGQVQNVMHRHVPELTDEMAEKVAGVASIAELRDKVKESLMARKEMEATGVAKRRLLDKLLDETTFEPPESLVESEARERLESIGRNLAAQGVDLDKAEIDWEKVIEEERVAAQKSVREALLLDRIAATEKLDVEASEIDRAIEGMARESGESPQKVRQHLKKDNGLNALRIQLLRRKSLDWVYEKTDIR